ncbi:MAG: hypothetical protein ABI551_00460 [Polyangiaceae bacterium]
MKSRGSNPNDGRVLALVPVVVALVMLALMARHAAPPGDVPLPALDLRALAATEAADDARTAAGARSGLPAETRALGSAIRDFDVAEAKGDDRSDMLALHESILRTLPDAMAKGPDALLTLRATQTTIFVRELEAFEKTGRETDELLAVAGPFVSRMRDAGWVDRNHVTMDVHARRAAYKTAWNAIVGVEAIDTFALTLDESRALYMFYLAHPHVGERDKQALDLAREGAKTEKTCRTIDLRERQALEAWRLEKIDKLGKIDPTYPLAYARGVSHYRLGMSDNAVRDFQFWLDNHPDGPWTLRARNQLDGAAALTDR